jgi:hypothetical protein
MPRFSARFKEFLASLWNLPGLGSKARILESCSEASDSQHGEKMLVTPSTAAPIPVILGVPRSSTTLTRLMLDSHPDLAIPPETAFLTLCAEWSADGVMSPDTFVDLLANFPPDAPGWNDFGVPREDLLEAVRAVPDFHPIKGVRCFFEVYARRFGKTRWGEKTPDNLHHAAQIHRAFPEARFVHIVRDPRDVVLSWRATWFAPSKDLAVLAAAWESRITIARGQMAKTPHAIEIRYEDLVERTEPTLRRLCEFLELDFHPAMLQHHLRSNERLKEHGERRRKDGTMLVTLEQRLHQQHMVLQPPDVKRVAAWKNTMTTEARLAVEGAIGPLLEELGYGPRLCAMAAPV